MVNVMEFKNQHRSSNFLAVRSCEKKKKKICVKYRECARDANLMSTSV